MSYYKGCVWRRLSKHCPVGTACHTCSNLVPEAEAYRDTEDASRFLPFYFLQLPFMTQKLPNEIWATILEYILKVPDDDFISHTTSSGPFSQRHHSNAVVLLVCKRWLRTSTPLVYRTCIIRSQAQAQALDDALKKNPEFGALMKQLRLEGCYGVSVPNILEKATGLEDLAIKMPVSPEDNTRPAFATLHTLTPRRLIVCNTGTPGDAQASFARTALRRFLKTCNTLVSVSATTNMHQLH